MTQWVDLGSKSFSVSVQGAAKKGSFDVSVSPQQVQAGGSVSVTVTVSNPNPFDVQAAINATLFGSSQSKTITVSKLSKGSHTFTFTAPSTPGTYTGSVQVSMGIPEGYAIPV